MFRVPEVQNYGGYGLALFSMRRSSLQDAYFVVDRGECSLYEEQGGDGGSLISADEDELAKGETGESEAEQGVCFDTQEIRDFDMQEKF